MAENITIHDFGKAERERARKLSRLLDIAAEHEADILRNPLPHLQRAGEEITRLRKAIRAAQDAMRRTAASFSFNDQPDLGFDAIRVPRDEYERLKAMQAIIDRALD